MIMECSIQNLRSENILTNFWVTHKKMRLWLQESVLNNIWAKLFLEDETFELNEVVIESEKSYMVKETRLFYAYLAIRKRASGRRFTKKIPGLN
jgi:hypothetical protein